jgi:hypothetical protein
MKVVIAAVMLRANLRIVSVTRRAARRTVTLVPAGGTPVVLESLVPRAPSGEPASRSALAS